MPAGRGRAVVDTPILAFGSVGQGLPSIAVGLKVALHRKSVLLGRGIAA